jgi:hypothetical protein
VTTSTRGIVGAGSLALVLALGACGGGDDTETGDDDETTEETTGSTADDSTTSAAPSPEDEALAAYRASQEFLSAALGERPPNPEHPELGDHFSGTALSDTVQILFSRYQNNEYVDDTIRTNPRTASVTSDEVLLVDCVEETIRVLDVATGAEKESGTSVYNFRVTVTREDAGWRVSEITPQDEPCTP